MKYLFATIILFLLLVSCNENKKHKDTDQNALFIDQSEILFPAEDFISEIELVPLEVTDNSIIRSIDKIEKNNSLYYILDKRNNIIYTFDSEGRFLKNIDRKGGGADEYVYIKDFCIHNNLIVVLTYPSKLIFFDEETLEPTSNTHYFERQYSQIESHKGELYLYDNKEGCIDQYSIEKQETSTILHYKAMQGYIPNAYCLFKYEDNLYAYIADEAIIYQVQKDTVSIYKEIDYENKKGIISFLNNREMKPLAPLEIGEYSLPSDLSLLTINKSIAYFSSFKGMLYMNALKNGNRETYYLGSNTPLMPGSIYGIDNQLVSWTYLFYLQENDFESPINKEIKNILSEKYSAYMDDPETPFLIMYRFKN